VSAVIGLGAATSCSRIRVQSGSEVGDPATANDGFAFAPEFYAGDPGTSLSFAPVRQEAYARGVVGETGHGQRAGIGSWAGMADPLRAVTDGAGVRRSEPST
jgi:hypothetical protein